MNKKVTLRELVGARIILAICIAAYYWCWARNDWQSYYTTITNTVGMFAILFFILIASRERKYKKEMVDEFARTNLRRCDSICFKITMAAIVCIGFLSAILRLTVSSEIIGYMLIGLFVCVTIIRTVIFCIMDTKGV